jgi:hypothetical protein
LPHRRQRPALLPDATHRANVDGGNTAMVVALCAATMMLVVRCQLIERTQRADRPHARISALDIGDRRHGTPLPAGQPL